MNYCSGLGKAGDNQTGITSTSENSKGIVDNRVSWSDTTLGHLACVTKQVGQSKFLIHYTVICKLGALVLHPTRV